MRLGPSRLRALAAHNARLVACLMHPLACYELRYTEFVHVSFRVPAVPEESSAEALFASS